MTPICLSAFPCAATLPALALAEIAVLPVLMTLLASLLIGALAASAWWYARVNQASIAALQDLAGQLRNQSRLIGDELLVMRRQLDLMRHQWEQERKGRLEFWLTAVDDEDVRMPFKPPFGSKRNTMVSGWILEAWNPSNHLVRLVECTLLDLDSGIRDQAAAIRLIHAEEAWVLPLTERLLWLAGQVSEVRHQGNWKKLLEQPLSIEIAMRFLGNDGVEQCLSQRYQVQLAGGWERFDLRIAGPGGSLATLAPEPPKNPEALPVSTAAGGSAHG